MAVGAPVREALRLSDGTRLVASVWRPETREPLPVLLMRQPYGLEIASTVTLAHPSWYAAQGYIVAVQDVRGTGESEGDFDALTTEAEDGRETLDWARGLDGANGKVGTYGFSYHGTTQFLTLAAGGRPDAMAVAMGSWDPLTDWASEAGLFRAEMSTRWAAQMAYLKAFRLGDSEALAALAPGQSWTALFAYLRDRPDLSHLARWTEGDVGERPAQLLSDVPAVPLLQTAGAADFLLRGSLAADAAFRAVSPGTTHLIFGPWAHIGWNRSAGAARLGPGAELSVDRAQLAFFDHYLKGSGPAPAPLRAYDAGTDSWRQADPAGFADPTQRRYGLDSGGLAATLLSDGRLTAADGMSQDVLVHDPHRPAPLVGGAMGNPPGPVERGAQDDRTDVACYTSAPLAAGQMLFGRAEADLAARIEGEVPALAASLSLVTETGAALALATTVAPVENGRCRLVFDGLCRTLHPGEALRLSVQAAPGPEVLPFPVAALPRPGVRATTITLHHSGSALYLPLTDQGEVHA